MRPNNLYFEISTVDSCLIFPCFSTHLANIHNPIKLSTNKLSQKRISDRTKERLSAVKSLPCNAALAVSRLTGQPHLPLEGATPRTPYFPFGDLSERPMDPLSLSGTRKRKLLAHQRSGSAGNLRLRSIKAL